MNLLIAFMVNSAKPEKAEIILLESRIHWISRLTDVKSLFQQYCHWTSWDVPSKLYVKQNDQNRKRMNECFSLSGIAEQIRVWIARKARKSRHFDLYKWEDGKKALEKYENCHISLEIFEATKSILNEKKENEKKFKDFVKEKLEENEAHLHEALETENHSNYRKTSISY